ncbi:hypothetical protein PCE1_000920 [Barthelona sp. PCE]
MVTAFEEVLSLLAEKDSISKEQFLSRLSTLMSSVYHHCLKNNNLAVYTQLLNMLQQNHGIEPGNQSVPSSIDDLSTEEEDYVEKVSISEPVRMSSKYLQKVEKPKKNINSRVNRQGVPLKKVAPPPPPRKPSISLSDVESDDEDSEPDYSMPWDRRKKSTKGYKSKKKVRNNTSIKKGSYQHSISSFGRISRYNPTQYKDDEFAEYADKKKRKSDAMKFTKKEHFETMDVVKKKQKPQTYDDDELDIDLDDLVPQVEEKPKLKSIPKLHKVDKPKKNSKVERMTPHLKKKNGEIDGEGDDPEKIINALAQKIQKIGGKHVNERLNRLDDEEWREKLAVFDEHLVTNIISEIIGDITKVKFNDIAGLEQCKRLINEHVILPKMRPDLFKGLRSPTKGVLLFGPPGNGKTMLAKAIASSLDVTFFSVSASSLTSKWIGEGEKLVRILFTMARLLSPSIVFLDEIDSLLTSRTDGENDASRRMKTEFMVQLDGLGNENSDILSIGATNVVQQIDSAIRRRFTRRIYVPLPDIDARSYLIRSLLSKLTHSLNDGNIQSAAELTEGYSGHDLHLLMQEVAYMPIRDLTMTQIETIASDRIRAVCFDDFEKALSSVRPSCQKKEVEEFEKWNEKYGSG